MLYRAFMQAWCWITRWRTFLTSIAILAGASRASAQEPPQRPGAPASFAAAGAPAEVTIPERRTPLPERDGAATTEDRLVLPDDAPAPPRRRWASFQKRRATLEGHLGLGTPVGTAGLMLDCSIVPQLSLAAGAGFGSGPNNALHAAIAMRARPVLAPGDHDTAVLEVAFSTGGYQRFEAGTIGPPADGFAGTAPAGPSATWAHFIQFAAGWEHRTDKGVLMRLDGGIAAMLNPGALRCLSSYCAPVGANLTELVAVLDFAVGPSF